MNARQMIISAIASRLEILLCSIMYQSVIGAADIYEEINKELKKYGPGLDTECVGGGRINHNSAKQAIKVYGYSQGFGKADHQVSVGLLKQKYPNYVITWSDDGY
ncbi:14 kDa phosphohistidine phosphatase-like isoform X2 [Aphidius gifuensis]|uniref:14 kDa phosphohistidine phosphatase-like isoform X2 n=1 Tax=Aphidius gifuensis TaxID=684658 RepID=UPI001CDBEF63|nr:14 kDa phosphohistidine phosphatase-like isoform X2 [Aphidius gifuensis]